MTKLVEGPLDMDADLNLTRRPKPYIIAEIGSNWRVGEDKTANFENATHQIGIARELGASAVKFQLYTHKELYGVDGDDTFALPTEWVVPLSYRCEEIGIDFMCSTFSIKGFDFVDPYVKAHKIASSKLCDDDFCEHATKSTKDLFFSTGMIDRGFWEATPLICASNYPANIWDYELPVTHETIWRDWGLSDHTLTNDLALLCRANGATHFEKHVNLVGVPPVTPDACVSIGVNAFREYIHHLNKVPPTHAADTTERARKRYGDRYQPHLKGWFRPEP